jgi:hypothetical protein
MEQQKTDIAAASEMVSNPDFEQSTKEWKSGDIIKGWNGDPQTLNPEIATALEELQFQIHMEKVARSRKEHVDFVKRYMGAEYEPKFVDVRSDKTYYAVFYRNKKTAHVAVPPINMRGQVEHLTAGRIYECSGYDVRMLERVLASKKIEVLNVTPATDKYQIEFVEIINKWLKPWLPGEVDRTPKQRTNAFAKYRGTEDIPPVKEEREDGQWVNEDLVVHGTETGRVSSTEETPSNRPTLGEAQPELVDKMWEPIYTKEDAEFQKFVQSNMEQINETLTIQAVSMDGVEVTELEVEDVEFKMADNDPVNDTPDDGTEPNSDYTDQVDKE